MFLWDEGPRPVVRNALDAARSRVAGLTRPRREPASGGSPAPKVPRAAQIRTAIQSAERSADLWATINICDTKRHPDSIGIRGQIPSLPFTANLAMEIGVDYYSIPDKRFKPVPGATKSIGLGAVSTGVHQGGSCSR